MADKRLTRTRTDRVVAGVCGGIGHYLDVDPVVVRVVWAIATVFMLGGGIIAYIVAWFIIPEEPLPSEGEPPRPGESEPADDGGDPETP